MRGIGVAGLAGIVAAMNLAASLGVVPSNWNIAQTGGFTAMPPVAAESGMSRR
jgi:hypothetical protein